MTGISVTPVIGFIGELNGQKITPNRDEVELYFTVSMKDIVDEKNWVVKENATPIFTGGPYVIWGLTAYLLHKFVKDVVNKCTIVSSASQTPEKTKTHDTHNAL